MRRLAARTLRWVDASLAVAGGIAACAAACSHASAPPSVRMPSPCEAGGAAPTAAVRGPSGIYAYVVVESFMARPADQSPGNVDAYLSGLYASLLANPAIAGLDMRIHWATLNPNDPAASATPYAWDALDLAFAAVAAWNTAHAQSPKTIQLNIVPGFESPSWIFDSMTSCDPPLSAGSAPFATPPPASPPPGQACDYSYFLQTEGTAQPYPSLRLPMPWSQPYVGFWRTFLEALAARYGKNPALVSIAIGGPTATSTEMIMPHDTDIDPSTMAPPFATQWQNDLVHWNYLFAAEYGDDPAHQNSDQAFIDGWNAAIDMYGTIFRGITLIATTGDGLPVFSPPAASAAQVPASLLPACAVPDMECAVQAVILQHSLDPGVARNDAKAVEEEGLIAAQIHESLDFDATAMKWLANATSGPNPVLGGCTVSPLLAGLEEGTSFSVREMTMGCLATSTCPDAEPPVQRCASACSAPGCTTTVDCTQADSGAPPSAEQSLYNMMQAYFDGTPVAGAFGVTPGPGRLDFYQFYADDIFYAQGMTGCASTNFVDQERDAGTDAGLAACTLPNPGSSIVTADGAAFVTDQQLLEQASSLVLQMAQTPLANASPGDE
jgi:hypothetical protein